MQLIDHGVSPRGIRSPVLAPRETAIDDNAFRHRGGRVELTGVEVVAIERITEQRRAVHEPSGDRARVGVEEQLQRVVAQSVSRVVLPMHTQAVTLSGTDLVDVPMPDEIGTLLECICRCFGAVIVEEHDLDRISRGRVHGEVGALAVPGGTERCLTPGPRLVTRSGPASRPSSRGGHAAPMMAHLKTLTGPLAHMLIVQLMLPKFVVPGGRR